MPINPRLLRRLCYLWGLPSDKGMQERGLATEIITVHVGVQDRVLCVRDHGLHESIMYVGIPSFTYRTFELKFVMYAICYRLKDTRMKVCG